MTYRYRDLIALYPNLAPNSKSPNYRKVKELYDMHSMKATKFEDGLHIFMQVLDGLRGNG